MTKKRRTKYSHLREMVVRCLDHRRQSEDMSKHDVWVAIESRYRQKHGREYQSLMLEALTRYVPNLIATLLRNEKSETDARVRVFGTYVVRSTNGKKKHCWKRWEYMPPYVFREAWKTYVATIAKDLLAATAQEAYLNGILEARGLSPLDATWRQEFRDILGRE